MPFGDVHHRPDAKAIAIPRQVRIPEVPELLFVQVVGPHQVYGLSPDDPLAVVDSAVGKHLREFQVVPYGGIKPCATHLVDRVRLVEFIQEPGYLLVFTFFVLVVNRDHTLFDVVLVPVACILHAERIEYFLLQELADRLSGNHLDERSNDIMPVPVQPTGPGFECDRYAAHRAHFGHDVVFPVLLHQFGLDLLHLFRRREVAEIIRHAARHCECVLDQYGIFGFPYFDVPVGMVDVNMGVAVLREVLVQGLVQQELAPFEQHHARRTDDHLGHRKEAENRIFGHRSLLLDVGIPEITLVQDLPVLCDSAAAAGRSDLHELFQQP